jgi:MFS family permease
MAAVWIWVDVLLAANGQSNAETAKFLGRLNVAFALVVIAGVFGVINGWLTAHSGRRNNLLLIGLVVAFVSGLFVACSATSGYQGS